jgi:hypothetical protein
MKVRIVPEDYPNDCLILKPIVKAMFAYLDKPRAQIDVHSPRVRGWDAVKKIDLIQEIIDKFPTVHLFLVCVDRDGHDQRRAILDDLESKARRLLRPPRVLLAEHAWQEIEVWALAGIDWKLKPAWSWDAIRNERDPKERFFEPVVQARGLLRSPGQGREQLGEEAARNYSKVRQNCPEIRDLETRIGQWLHKSGFS